MMAHCPFHRLNASHLFVLTNHYASDSFGDAIEQAHL
jgi:hypothetical protein